MAKKDTRKGDRHRPGYWVEYGRKRRAREREAKALGLERVVSYREKGDEK